MTEKIIVNRMMLLNALSKVEKSVAKKSLLPVLRGVLVDCVGNSCTLTATNFETTITTTLKIENESEAVFIAPFDVFKKLIENIFSDTVELLYDEKTSELKVDSNKSKNTIKCFFSEEFPEREPMPADAVQLVLSADFIESVSSTVAIASSKKDFHFSLEGVNFEFDENKNKLYAIASDGIRAAMRTVDVEGDASKKGFSVLLPSTSIERFAKLFQGDVKLIISRDWVEFRDSNTTAVSSTIDEIFPDVRSIIEDIVTNNDSEIQIQYDEFYQACKTAKIFAQQEKNVLLISFGDGGKSLPEVSAENDQTGGSSNMFTAEFEENGSIKLNATYLFDYLKLKHGNIKMKTSFTTPAPVLLYSNKENYYYLVMPIL